MKLKLLFLFMFPVFAFAQITPQFRDAGSGNMRYTWSGKSPAGYDTLWNAQTLRTYISTTTPIDSALRKAKNLYDVPDKAIGRANLQVKQSYIPASASTTYTFNINGVAAKLLTSSTYSNTGTANKLVIFLHYYGGTVNSAPPNKMADSLRANGYSIAQLSAGNSWGNEPAQNLYGALYQYLQQYYNFETQVYLVSESMGTLTALNIIDKKLFPVKQHVGITPVVNLYGYYNAAIGLTAGNTIQAAYNFTQSIDSCYKATFGYNPYQRIQVNFSDTTYSENNIPTYFAQGKSDSYIGWTRSLYKGALNAGHNYYMYEATGFGHDTLLLTSSVLHNIMIWMNRSTNPSLVRTPPAIIPQFYDATNRRWGWGRLPTAYKYEMYTTDISNRIMLEDDNTSQFANSAIYFKLTQAAASGQNMDMQLVKNSAGSGTGTSNFNIRSGSLFATNQNYDWLEILNSGTASTLNLSAPAQMMFSIGYLAASGTNTGGIFMNAYGDAAKTFRGVVFGSGNNTLNGSGANFQFKSDVVPYIDNTYTFGTASFKWSNVISTNLQLSITGLLKGNGAGSNVSAAVANTDYLPVTAPVSTGIFTYGSSTGVVRNTTTFNSASGTTADSLGFWSGQKKVAKLITAGTGMTITQSAAGVTFATTALVNPMTTSGDVMYGGASGVATRLAGNITTTPKFLASSGNGTISAAPVFYDIFNNTTPWAVGQQFNGGVVSKQFGLSVTDASGGFTTTLVQQGTPSSNKLVQIRDQAGVMALTSDLPIAGSFSGVGTATTTFTVTIGSTQPNNTYKTLVTPTSSLSAALFYVTNKTTTTFDVVYLAGLTGTVTFDWSVLQ